MILPSDEFRYKACFRRAAEKLGLGNEYAKLAERMDSDDSIIIPCKELRTAGFCDAQQKMDCMKAEDMRQSQFAHGADALLNPLPEKDRFGATYKNGSLFYGVLVANTKGQILPAVVGTNKQFLLGKDALESIGLNFGEVLMPKTVCEWNRERIYHYLTTEEAAPTTTELFKRIRDINRKIVFHSDERAHDFFAVFTLASAVFVMFKQFARVAVSGMPDSGKSVQGDVLARLCPNSIASADASPASLKRDVEVAAGLVFNDNYDNGTEEQRAEFTQYYDTSFEAGRETRRCGEEKRGKIEVFRTYSPGLVNAESFAWMRQSSRLRTVFVQMVRADEEMTAQLVKLKDVPTQEFVDLQHLIRIWALENVEAVAATSTTIKPKFSNRDGDLALPFLSVAKLAGEGVYSTIEAFLTDNFARHHCEEDYSDTAVLVLAIWNEVKTAKDPEVSVGVREIAAKTLAERGICDTDETGRPTRGFSGKLQEECRKVSAEIKAKVPYRKITRPQNFLHFTFNRIELARFIRSRKIALSEGEQGGLQDVL
ncbi:MAG: hypothetical protein PHF51_00175 [Candidatus ainarchaeum sp.]|nr:hypothetical protein [Candidatus ainarchaeum sp.]